MGDALTMTGALVGSPIERYEDLRFLTGRGTYVGDLHREGVLHAVVVRSPIAHGRLRGIDAAAARALPGVHAVITAADLGPAVPLIPLRLQPMPQIAPFKQPVMASDRVRYVGEPLALVLARSAAIAEDAAERVLPDIEPLEPVVDSVAAARDATLLFDEAGTNRACRYTASRGDIEAAFRAAEYTRRERFSTQRHTALPMEPRGLLAHWDGERGLLTVWGAAKVPFFNRATVASMLGLSADAVELVENDVGGGFGARGEFYPEDFLIPFAARHVGHPVRWVEDRREHLISINHAREMQAELEIACRRDGTLLGIRGRVLVNTGAYIRSNGLTPPRNVAQFMTGPYRVPGVHIECDTLVTNKTPCGTYRAPGRFEGSFFCERLLDLAALDLGIGADEIRRRNLVREEEIPYSLARIAPGDNYADTETDSGDYHRTFERCLAEIDWQGRQHLQGALIDGCYHGLGIGCFIEGGAAGPKENARLTLQADGRVAVNIGSSALGQGLETAFVQIAADALGVSAARIAGVYHGSTRLVKEGFGSFHSRSVVMGGSAVLLAASRFRAALCAAAALRLGCRPEQVSLGDGRAQGPGGALLDWAELARPEIAVEESFSSHKHTYAYGSAAAHVTVDPRTGRVEVLDYVIVEDFGRIINPLMLKGQVIGSLLQGLGGTFMEHLVYDAQGQPLAGSLADYLIPAATDFPSLRAVVLEERPCPNNPLGAKGGGEGGIIAVGGVIASAVAAALRPLGIQPLDLPLSSSRIWQLIRQAETGAGGTR